MTNKNMVLEVISKEIGVSTPTDFKPKEFFRDRDGLYIGYGFDKNILPEAQVCEKSFNIKIDSFRNSRSATDKEMEFELPEDHMFSETEVCAVIASLIEKQPKGEEGVLTNDGYWNIFYTPNFVVRVGWSSDGRRWDVSAWDRGGRGWVEGGRVFAPETIDFLPARKCRKFNDTRTCWVLKCDIRKFFASIDHEILLGIMSKHISDIRIISLTRNIVSSFSSTESGKGLPLGNLTSQLLVNIYMNEFDQYAKHVLKGKCYIRYADDFVFLADKKERLEELLPHIEYFLDTKLKLKMHPDKVYIKSFGSGVDFLGWIHFPNHRVLRAASRKRMIRNLKKGSTDTRMTSYRGMLSHGNAHKLSTRYLT